MDFAVQAAAAGMVAGSAVTLAWAFLRRRRPSPASLSAAATAQRQLLEALSNGTDGVALYDSNYRLIICNERYRALLRPVSHMIQPGVRFEEIVRAFARVDLLATRLKGVKPVRVLAAGLYPFTAGAGTTFQDLCDHAGALTVAAEAGLQGHAPTPSEKLLVWRVEVLVAAGDDSVRTRLGELPCYRLLPAFKAGRVVVIPGPMMSSVSHHRIAAYEALARALHPERFR